MRFSFSVLACMLLLSCATQSPTLQNENGPHVQINWPSLPTAARVRYLYTFNGPEDLGYRVSFSNQIKEMLAGAQTKNMSRPYAIAVTEELIAVTDPGLSAVHIFDTKRKQYKLITSAGDINLSSPVGIALGQDRIFIADSALNSVFVIDDKYRLINTLTKFTRPTGLAFHNKSQRLYIADTHAHHVQIRDRNGKFIGTIGERGYAAGQFNFPSHLTVHEDWVYVNDTMNFRIQVFNLDGEFMRSFGVHGRGPGYFAQPKGIGVNSNGHVFVSESVAERIQIFNINGEFLMDFGFSGNETAAFVMPSGVALYNDKIYIADSGNHRVQVFQYLGKD